MAEMLDHRDPEQPAVAVAREDRVSPVWELADEFVLRDELGRRE